jgi:hypothetical protein
MPAQYQELHKQQAAIGWDQMLYGRWSQHWRILQQQQLYNKAGDNELNGVFQKKNTAQLSSPFAAIHFVPSVQKKKNSILKLPTKE